MGTSISEELRELCERGTTLRDREIVDESLRRADLKGLRADGITLREVDLRDAVLRDSEWLDCTLCDVRMDRSEGRDAIMRLCTLDRVHMAGSDLSGAKIEDSSAQGIVLDNVNLAGGSLMETDLTRATLRGANLRDVDASGAVLRGADLREADLRGASFHTADLRGADLRGAKIDEADLDGADLRGALLDDAAAPASAEEPEPTPSTGVPEIGLPMDDLMRAAGPMVVDMLQRGNQRGVFDEATLGRMLSEIGELGVDPSVKLDGPLEQILDRVSTLGVAPLLAAMHEGGDTPPLAVANLITGLMDDAELGDDATAEDLVAHLLQQLTTRPSSE